MTKPNSKYIKLFILNFAIHSLICTLQNSADLTVYPLVNIPNIYVITQIRCDICIQQYPTIPPDPSLSYTPFIFTGSTHLLVVQIPIPQTLGPPCQI